MAAAIVTLNIENTMLLKEVLATPLNTPAGSLSVKGSEMKKLLVACSLAILCTPTLAQNQPKPLESVTLTITPQELQVISNALAERPFKDVVGLWGKLERQVQEQQQAVQPPPTPAKPDEPAK